MPEESLKEGGLRLWAAVKEGQLVAESRSPWLISGCPTVMLLLACIGVAIYLPAWWTLLLLGGLTLAAGAHTWRQFAAEQRDGPLLGVISEEYIAIGCARRDQILIPWSLVDTGCPALPMNNQFVAIPVAAERLDDIEYQTVGGTTRPWDRRKYRCSVARITYNAAAGWVEVHVPPQQFYVRLLGAVYPMICALEEHRDAERKGSGA